MPEITRARALVKAAQSVTVLTGAGISTDSGIPDFRGPNGLWTRDPDAEKASNIRYYISDPDLRERNWARRASGELWADVKPNAGHSALVGLERAHKLHTLITQNVDELHQQAGIDPAKVVEIHGTTRQVACLGCGDRQPMPDVLDRVRAGEPDPPCLVCGGMLKSATVSFGQNLNPGDLERAETAAQECDLFMAIGSSLAVFPINQTVAMAAAAGARIVIVNLQATPYDDLADCLLNESISAVLPLILD